MFHNPFNNKVVADITKFLSEHRDDININPCLDEHAKKAADAIAKEGILEERRTILSRLFNEAVEACGCQGNKKDIVDFSKAVDKYVNEAKAIVVPGKKVSIPSPHANELKKVKPTIPGK